MDIRSRRLFITQTAAGGAVLLVGSSRAHATQGVTKDQIVIGSILDLSGPLVAACKPFANGLTLRAEQINASGGIHGRKIKLVLEDSGYDTKKGVLAFHKLVSQEKVFALLGALGSTLALGIVPTAIEKGIPYLFPLTAHQITYDPPHKLKFAAANSYQDTTRIGIEQMLKMKPYKRLGILYQDDDYGLEVLRGTEMALKQAGLPLLERTTYKRGATEFATQMQKLKAADLDLIILGTVVRETIGAAATARQLGYAGDFFGSLAAYQAVVARIGGKAVEGLYAVNEVPMPYRDAPGNPKALNEWLDEYKKRFNEDADLYSIGGAMYLDATARALEKVGPNLTVDAFVDALEAIGYPSTYFGNQAMTWTPTRRIGRDQVRIAQIQNGRWVNVTDFVR